MKGIKPTYDVFLSYAAQDAKFAADVARLLQSCELAVFDAPSVSHGRRVEESIWEAMAESQAFVVAVSRAEPSAATIFELGAAQGWNKPTYVVVADPASTRLPDFLLGLPVYPYARMEEVARDIKNTSGMLNESQTAQLIAEFQRLGESVDEVVVRPALLAKLTKQVSRRARRQVAPEVLARTLLRLRKAGALANAPKAKHAKVAE